MWNFYSYSLVSAKMEEELVQKKTERFNEEVNLHEFAQILRIDAKESATQQLFRIHDRVCIIYFLFIIIFISL